MLTHPKAPLFDRWIEAKRQEEPATASSTRSTRDRPVDQTCMASTRKELIDGIAP